jgi:hypothetical protein
MASQTITTTDALVYRSLEGGANINDSLAIRLAPGQTGTVYIQRSSKGTAASSTTSFFITDGEIYSTTLVAGEEVHAVTSTGSIQIRVEANDSGRFGA